MRQQCLIVDLLGLQIEAHNLLSTQSDDLSRFFGQIQCLDFAELLLASVGRLFDFDFVFLKKLLSSRAARSVLAMIHPRDFLHVHSFLGESNWALLSRPGDELQERIPFLL